MLNCQSLFPPFFLLKQKTSVIWIQCQREQFRFNTEPCSSCVARATPILTVTSPTPIQSSRMHLFMIGSAKPIS